MSRTGRAAQRAKRGADVERRRGRRAGPGRHGQHDERGEQREQRGRGDRRLPGHVAEPAHQVRRGRAERERADHDARWRARGRAGSGRDQPHARPVDAGQRDADQEAGRERARRARRPASSPALATAAATALAAISRRGSQPVGQVEHGDASRCRR